MDKARLKTMSEPRGSDSRRSIRLRPERPKPNTPTDTAVQATMSAEFCLEAFMLIPFRMFFRIY